MKLAAISFCAFAVALASATPSAASTGRLTAVQAKVPAGASTLPDGIRSVVLRAPAGSVAHPSVDDDVIVVAHGWFADGKPIDSPDLAGRPYTYHLRHLIRGWQIALVRMSPGERVRFWMPARATTSREHGNPGGAMIFDIHLLSFHSHHGPEQRPGIH